MNIKENVKMILHSREKKLKLAACALLFCLAAAMYIFLSGGQEEVKVDTAPHIQVAEKENGKEHKMGKMVYSVSGEIGQLRNPFSFEHEREGERPVHIAASVNKGGIKAPPLKNTIQPAKAQAGQNNAAGTEAGSAKAVPGGAAYVLKAVMQIGGRKMAIADIGGRMVRLREQDRAGDAAVVSIGTDSMVLQMPDGSAATYRLR